MTLIFDYLAATLISVTIFMLLVGTQFRLQMSGVEAVSAHAAKTKALSLGQWLEDDITSLGANFGNNLLRFTEPELDGDGNTSLWTFYSDSLGANGAVTRHMTRYQLTVVDTFTLRDGTARKLYQLHRQTTSTPVVNGTPDPVSAGSWATDGRSVATLSRFRIGLATRSGDPTTDVTATDYIKVEFALVPEFERERGYLQELIWTTMLKVRPFWHQSDPT